MTRLSSALGVSDATLFTGVRGSGILGSSYPASCIARSFGASKARLAPSNTKPKRYILWCRMDMHPIAWGFGLPCLRAASRELRQAPRQFQPVDTALGE